LPISGGGVFFAAGTVANGPAVIIFWGVQPLLDLLLFLVARSIARSARLPERMRRFWRALSFGGIAFFVGDTGQTVIAVRHPVPASAVPGTFQTVCFVAGTSWIVWVMLNYPIAARSAQEKLRFWLDATTVLVAAAVFAWTVTVKSDDQPRDNVQLVEVLLATALLIAAAFAAGKLVLSGDAPVSRAAAAPAIVGIVMQGVCTALTPTSATRCWSRSRSGCAPACVPATRRPGWAATNSRYCFPTPGPTSPPRSPNASWTRWSNRSAHGHLLRVRASVGIAVAHHDDPGELLRHADAAMYTAKREGRGRYFHAVRSPVADRLP